MRPMRVVKSVQERVYPATPSPGKLIQLSKCDQTIHRFYIPLVFFFEEKPPPNVFLLLKASLSDALAVFYPCAGRFRERSSYGPDLEIVCNDEGAVLHEAWVDVTYDHFAPHFDFHPDFPLLKPPSSHTMFDGIDPDAPPIVAQITHFECGRACLCISLFHPLCDGYSAAQFFSCWAMFAKSKASAAELEDEGSQPPYEPPHFDRSLLNPDLSSPSPAGNHPEYETHMTGMPTAGVTKLFPFSRLDIDAVMAKETLSSGGAAGSRFEALSGHIWRCITQARGLKPEQNIRMTVSMDGRNRLVPPLPGGYFGNAVFFGYIATTAGEVVEKPVSFAAGLVKEAIAKVSDEHIKSAVAWIAKQECVNSVHALPPSATDVTITSWAKFPFYQFDFGWGKPSFIRIPEASLLDGLVILLPSPLGRGHVDVAVGLREDHMPNFEESIKKASH